MSRQNTRLVALAVTLAGVSLAGCQSNPTGIPDAGERSIERPTGSLRNAETCYLIDGQIYCIEDRQAAPDSTSDGG